MMTNALECPICESNRLTAETYSTTLSLDGEQIEVGGLERYRCADCGADPVFHDQNRRNSARVSDARRINRGLLTGKEIAAVRAKLGLTQAQASEVFGGGPHAFSKYERGEVIQSSAMDRLLKICSTLPDAYELLLLLVGAEKTVRESQAG